MLKGGDETAGQQKAEVACAQRYIGVAKRVAFVAVLATKLPVVWHHGLLTQGEDYTALFGALFEY